MVYQISLVLVFVLMPALVLLLCRKVKWIGKLGPILTLYILGVIIGNLGNIFGFEMPESSASVQKILSGVTIPFAIPLMLLGCTFNKKDIHKYFLVLLTGLVAVIFAIIGGFFIFRHSIDSSAMSVDGAARIGGLLTGSYTGGTVNMASLKTMLGVSDSTYLLLNSYDMAIGFIFLIFLMSVGIKLSRRFIGTNKSFFSKLADRIIDSEEVVKEKIVIRIRQDKVKLKIKLKEKLPENIIANLNLDTPDEENDDEQNPYKGLGTKHGLKVLGILVAVSVVICGLSFLIQLPFSKDGKLNMTIFILALTTISIGASFVPKLRSLPYSYDVGMYGIYIFSIVVASMADVRNFDFSGGLGALGYLAFIVFVSLLIQAVLSRMLHLDADTAVIGSVALICSPPFVPMISAAMRNRRVLAAGLAIGIVGYAVGTYLGYGIFRLLSLF
ncbi:MAG: DUF819 family protein [Bacteroidales bacterium]|nr:DUF819 family protein [Bacteroidales bacterium]